MQVAALENLLGFLSDLAPFKSLSRELLTTLAVFVRPVQLGQGQLLAVAGDKVEGLIIVQVGLALSQMSRTRDAARGMPMPSPCGLSFTAASCQQRQGGILGSCTHPGASAESNNTVMQEGEVKLLDAPAGSLLADATISGSSSCNCSTAGTAGSSPLLPRSRRATADDMGLRSRCTSSTGSSDSGVSNSRSLFRQLSSSAAAAGAGGAGGISSSSPSNGAAAAVQSILPSSGVGLSALSLGRLQQSSAPLSVLGSGSLLGENVLGYDPEQVSQIARYASTTLSVCVIHNSGWLGQIDSKRSCGLDSPYDVCRCIAGSLASSSNSQGVQGPPSSCCCSCRPNPPGHCSSSSAMQGAAAEC